MKLRSLLIVLPAICLYAGCSTKVAPHAKDATANHQPMPTRFTWVAANERPFTDAEIKRIAENYSWVIIEKNHAGFDAKKQEEDARRFKAANPNIRVFMNYLAGLQSKAFQNVFAPLGFKEEWFLTNDRSSGEQKKGDKIPFVIRKEIHGYFTDVSNTDYRHFLENIVVARLKNSSFDGVMFDNFRPPLGKVSAGLSPSRLTQQWDALGLLLEEIKPRIPAGKLILFNGITRGDGENHRGLAYLKTADAGHDEYFCYIGGPDKLRPAKQVRDDIDLLTKYGAQGKIILYAVKLAHSKALNDEARLAQVKRYCYGCFVMGWQPGHSFLQFRTAATIEQGQLDGNESPELHLDLGTPKSPYTQDGLLLKREFTKGWVFVNQDTSPKQIVLPADLRRADGGKAGQQFRKGASCIVAAEDAAFFLREKPAKH